jgi:hypothetical protein
MKDIIVISVWALTLFLAAFIHYIVSVDRRGRVERPGYESELPDTWV